MTATLTDDSVPVLPHVVYANELRIHAVTLIWMGHQRLDASSFAAADEDVITGELVKATKLVIQDPASPEWVDRYEVHEQVPQNVEGKQGKRRPQMDIELERRGRGSRPRLGFEAKRLKKSSGLRDYLGNEGMSAFLSGYYPTTHGEAGMLGYVQEDSSDEWSFRFANELSSDSQKHQVVVDGGWRAMAEETGSPWFASQHLSSDQKPLGIVHVLLPFH